MRQFFGSFRWFLGSLLALALVLASFSPLDERKHKVKVVVIDAGHGGKDPGTLGKKNRESEIALAIALKLGKNIKNYLPDVKVIYTRQTNVFVELQERAAIANRNHADVFISIHCNSGAKSVAGSETYVMGLHTSDGNLEVAKRENAVIMQEDNYLDKYDGFNPKSPLAHIYFSNFQNAHLTNSLRLAEKVENQFKSRAKRQSRGVKQAGFVVLWRTAMPSILVETGYLSHPKDEAILSSEKGQTLIAASIYRALRDYKKEVEALN